MSIFEENISRKKTLFILILSVLLPCINKLKYIISYIERLDILYTFIYIYSFLKEPSMMVQ